MIDSCKKPRGKEKPNMRLVLSCLESDHGGRVTSAEKGPVPMGIRSGDNFMLQRRGAFGTKGHWSA